MIDPHVEHGGASSWFCIAAKDDVRGEVLATHWRVFLEDPLRGHGLGTFDLLNRTRLTPDTFPRLWSIRAAHNLYLQWLEEGGLVAATPMAACLALIVAVTVRGAVWRRPDGRSALGRKAVCGLTWSLVGLDAVFVLHGLSDFALQTPSVAALFALTLGLQCGLAWRPTESAGGLRRSPFYATAGGAVAAAAAVALVALLSPAVPRLGSVEIFPLAAGYDRRAAAALAATPPDLSAAKANTLRAITLFPYDTAAVARLAYLDRRVHGRLTAEGAAQFQRSYDLVPLDQAIALWRVRFALENWGELAPNSRAAARREFEALLSTRQHNVELTETLASVRGGRGALVAAFWSAEVQRAMRSLSSVSS